MTKKILFFVSLLFISTALLRAQEEPQTPEPITNEDCFACHDQINETHFSKSVHGAVLGCTDCHTAITELPHEENLPKVNCAECHTEEAERFTASVHGNVSGDEAPNCVSCHGDPHLMVSLAKTKSPMHRSNVPQTCGKCHTEIQQQFEQSIHGQAVNKGIKEAPVCTDCHGEHDILAKTDSASKVHPANLAVKTCGHCHAAERITSKYQLPSNVVDTYMESYHGLASQFGSATVANCASCHGVHNILPSTDPSSKIHPSNLPKTCGQCHPGAGAQLASAKIHTYSSIEGTKVVYYVSFFYIALILIVVAFIFFHNAVDFIAKFKEHCAQKEKNAAQLRFTPGERLQHRALTILFLILVYTGFALKYPRAWWAFPLTSIKTGYDWRGLVHKTAGFSFTALTIYHLLLLVWTRRGRKQLKALAPEKKDFQDLFQVLKHNLGWGGPRPKFKRYNYTEKIEYWALIWGSAIMILTGFMLSFENYFLSFLPKWGLDVATAVHFYEAVLASLAILMWHFYFVFFDPDHYPMNLSMSTGKVTDKEKRLNDDLSSDIKNEENKKS